MDKKEMNLINNSCYYFFFGCFAFYFRKRGGSLAVALN